jgi:teichuronic acid biosynthesis glycosyltransferase TuaH
LITHSSKSTDQPTGVWLAGVSWDSIPGTDRHMATAMTQYAQVLWVDPPISPVRQSFRDSLTGRSLWPLLSVEDGAVTRLTPKTLPGVSRPLIRAITLRLVQIQVKWALRRINASPAAVVATQLEAPLAGWGPGVMKVLYGTDDYVAGAELMGLSTRRQLRQELRALTHADLVAGVSPGLVGRWTDLGATPQLIPNGCWPAGKTNHRMPLGLPDLARPVVGLVGQLSDRIDLGVLEAIAGAGYSLLIVGPLDPRWDTAAFRTLISASHVHYAGPVPASVVPDYLGVMDIGITPYRDTSFNQASFPLKTLEYLGAGVPVVSTALPAAQWLQADLARAADGRAAPRVLELATTAEDFVDAIRRILGDGPFPENIGHERDGGDAVSDICVALATRHSWPKRASALAGMMALDERSGQSAR